MLYKEELKTLNLCLNYFLNKNISINDLIKFNIIKNSRIFCN